MLLTSNGNRQESTWGVLLRRRSSVPGISAINGWWFVKWHIIIIISFKRLSHETWINEKLRESPWVREVWRVVGPTGQSLLHGTGYSDWEPGESPDSSLSRVAYEVHSQPFRGLKTREMGLSVTVSALSGRVAWGAWASISYFWCKCCSGGCFKGSGWAP